MFRNLLAGALAGLAVGGAISEAEAQTTDEAHARLFLFIDPRFAACDGGVLPAPAGDDSFCDRRIVPQFTLDIRVADDGTLTGSEDLFVLADGRVVPVQGAMPADAEGRIQLALEGSVFPQLGIAIGFVDHGAPTMLAVSVNRPIPPVADLAGYEIEDELTLAEGTGVTAALPGGTFFAHLAGATLVGAPVGGTVLGPGTALADEGQVDCGIGGCTDLWTQIGLAGPGGGVAVSVASSFGLRPATPPPAPVPAGFPLPGIAAELPHAIRP